MSDPAKILDLLETRGAPARRPNWCGTCSKRGRDVPARPGFGLCVQCESVEAQERASARAAQAAKARPTAKARSRFEDE